MNDDITRVEYMPAGESRTPAQDGPVEERSIVSELISDANGILVGGGSGIVTAVAIKIIDKVSDKSPPDGGQGD